MLRRLGAAEVAEADGPSNDNQASDEVRKAEVEEQAVREGED